MFPLGEQVFARPSQSLNCPENHFVNDLPCHAEAPRRGLAFRSNPQNPNPKVPIPRRSTPTSWSNKGRVSQACKTCHGLKTKCSGHRPVCQRCDELGIVCNYGDRKRDMINKKLDDQSAHIGMLESLLRNVYPSLDAQSAQYVDQTLRNSKILTDSRASLALPELGQICESSEPTLATTDYTEEDFNRYGELQALGFVGEHSEMMCLYRLMTALEQDNATSKKNLSQSSIVSVNYYTDYREMGIQDELNMYERPEQSMADQLIDTYFRMIHPSFPLIGKTTFLAQYHSFYSDPSARPGKQWLAVLNFVFAIAANHLSPAEKVAGVGYFLHLGYFSRAWMLSMDKAALRNYPNLQQIQVEGLAALYLLANGQVNRSWRCCGIALRSALAMGLNLRSESHNVAPLSKEIRYRVWWALCLLDTSLSTITGRPPGISGEFNTTPLPIPFEEEDLHSDNSPKYIEDRAARNSLVGKFLDNKDRDTTKESFTNNVLLQRTASKHRSLDGKPTLTVAKVPPPNDSLCFFYAARLTTIMREVLHTLYAPGVAYNSWREIELARSSLNTKVDIWHSSLPASYKFPSMSGAESIRHQSVKLAFQFYSTKLYITRPCLRRLAASSAEESDSPTTASDPMQEICIQAVCRLIDILPDEPDLTWLYGVCPIWCALHYLIQALNVMLTESFISAKLGTSQIICILPRLRKARAWLEELSKTNTSARKARMIFSDLISRHGSRLGLDG